MVISSEYGISPLKFYQPLTNDWKRIEKKKLRTLKRLSMQTVDFSRDFTCGANNQIVIVYSHRLWMSLSSKPIRFR